MKSEQLALDVLKHWDVTKVYDPEIRKCLDEQADYVYPYYSEGGMKMKFTVSELKKRKALQEEAGEEMYKEPQTVPLLPRFIKEEETLSGASRGSAYHKFLELLDFAKNTKQMIWKQRWKGLRKMDVYRGKWQNVLRQKI